MVVKTELANGRTEVFETSNYVISKTKDFHPLLCKVSIYDNGKKIKSVSRPFKFIYKHFIFKSEKVQKLLVELENKKENQIQEEI